jgi:hypothetical protein
MKMNQWIDKLEMAESNDNEKLNELDVNGKYSRGCLQFQDATWEWNTKKYGVTGSQFDCQTERQVTMDMIQSDYSAWSNWWTSVKIKGVGYPPKKETAS